MFSKASVLLHRARCLKTVFKWMLFRNKVANYSSVCPHAQDRHIRHAPLVHTHVHTHTPPSAEIGIMASYCITITTLAHSASLSTSHYILLFMAATGQSRPIVIALARFVYIATSPQQTPASNALVRQVSHYHIIRLQGVVVVTPSKLWEATSSLQPCHLFKLLVVI